jgi:hypothetical protein
MILYIYKEGGVKKNGTKRKVKCYLMNCIYNTISICVQKSLYVYKKKCKFLMFCDIYACAVQF